MCGYILSVGIGRFVYTPLMPLMVANAGLSPSSGAVIAAIHYVGYLVGAVVLSFRPEALTRKTFRIAIAAIVISELGMVLAPGGSASVMNWAIWRLVAGIASAFVFIGCSTTVTASARRHTASPGLAFSGVGLGIALSGLVALILGTNIVGLEQRWSTLWIVSGVMSAALASYVWNTPIEQARRVSADETGARYLRRRWWSVMTSYSLEGIGYIILGTFIVAAVSVGQAGGALGPTTWIIVGLAAAPSCIMWGHLAMRLDQRWLLTTALGAQLVGALLGAVTGTVPALALAVLFGGTFMGIVMLAMMIGEETGTPQSAAKLTTGYGIGQILGPLVVLPVIGNSYAMAFYIAAGILLVAMLSAVLMGTRSPQSHGMG